MSNAKQNAFCLCELFRTVIEMNETRFIGMDAYEIIEELEDFAGIDESVTVDYDYFIELAQIASAGNDTGINW